MNIWEDFKLNISKIDQPYQGKVGSSTRKPSASGFKEVFNKKINEINGTSSQNLVEGKVNVLKQGDRILNLLDDYGRVLTDPAKTLKEIEPLVDRIEEEVNLFEVEAEKVGKDDTSLNRITHDLATTAQVALLKFRRGDFI